MGASSSSEFDSSGDLTDNDSLLLFAGELPIAENDQFWDTFLTFTLKPPTTREIDEAIGNRLKPVCKMLFMNNLKTGNFATLLKYISKHSAVSCLVPTENNENASITRCRFFNALFVARCFTKYLIEHTNETELLNHFSPSVDSPKEENSKLVSFQEYMQILVDSIVKLPVLDSTYELHIEVINSLLVLLSVPLFACIPANQYTSYKFMMEIAEANTLLKTLLQRYIEQPKRPVKSPSNLFYELASDIWNFFAFHRQDEDETFSPLANHAVLLMLVLINHSSPTISNPYRNSISSYTANVNGLYEVLCQTIKSEENTLLLYHLLHCNVNFRNYLLARSDIELMLFPILRRIYNAADNNCHHMYMSLIILLILTEDQLFNKTIHSMMLKGIPWYTERVINEVSLGGLIILVTARTIQFNLLRMRDKYLHTNCLAALANMSSQFTNLHPYVCQRLISLFEVLTKTHSRANVDVMAVEEAIRIILEVINSCLTHQLIHNTNLVYTLLYNKHVFQPFRNHEAFHDVIQNIDLVITYFSKKLEKENEQSNDVNEILEKVQRWSLQWPRDLLKKFPDLKFKYVEEERPEEFFIPYVWSLVGKSSGIYWNAALYKL
ncbi:dymeclin [Planococcus citri]|uniref:dymeclin n=1 Tax=Planococcus citri TaxID=170843 RepID=UPI0031F9CA07